MKKTLIAILATAAMPAAAQTVDTFTLPAGCTAYLTIQTESCSVDHIFTCEGDAEGTQRRAAIGERGLSGLYQIDGETQWLESIDIFSEETERLSDNVDDPVAMYLADIFTVQANMVGIPAICLPAGTHPEEGLPVGVQFMANRFQESDLLAFSQKVMDTLPKS